MTICLTQVSRTRGLRSLLTRCGWTRELAHGSGCDVTSSTAASVRPVEIDGDVWAAVYQLVGVSADELIREIEHGGER